MQLFIFLWLKQYIPAAVTNSLHGDLSVFIWMAFSKTVGLTQFLTAQDYWNKRVIFASVPSVKHDHSEAT